MMNVSRRRLLILMTGLAVVSLVSWGTALDDYVAEPDATYQYTVVGTVPGAGYTDYIVDMDSQTWLTPAEVDRTVWQHYLAITVPDVVVGTTGLLRIGSGNNDGAPPGNLSDVRGTAVATNSVTANLWYVPNQPLTFTGDVPRWEDAQIAYGWDKFLRGGRSEWLSRMPMTKAAVRAMDTISAVVASETGGSVTVDSYVVTGESKRGWTTWTTAAVDDRVVAFCPQVIDLLNVEPSFVHHYSALGRWAAAIQDYVDMDIPLWFGTRPFQDLLDLVDPYSYRDRYAEQPKFLINSAGDQFFLPDSSQFYYDDLPGEKHIRYVPNTGHSLNASAWDTLEAWYSAILTGTSLPEFSWTKEPDGSIIVTTTGDAPSQVLLWQATNPTDRDFNISIVGAIYASSVLAPTAPGVYHAQVSDPPSGWTAFFVELTYPSGGAHNFIFTTEVSVVPDTYPASFDPDTDGDGIPNSADSDDDNDGEPDIEDYRPLDTDNDALPNPIDTDDDADGIPDLSDSLPLDTDNDGLRNDVDPDDDDDGYSDVVERSLGTDPLDAFSHPMMPLSRWMTMACVGVATSLLVRRRLLLTGKKR